MDRRDLIRLMGASLALAGLTACEQRKPPLLSQPSSPEGQAADKPLYFATSLGLDGYGRGVLVKSHDGRPNKVEGNPPYPASLGATDVFMQAEILSDRKSAVWGKSVDVRVDICGGRTIKKK